MAAVALLQEEKLWMTPLVQVMLSDFRQCPSPERRKTQCYNSGRYSCADLPVCVCWRHNAQANNMIT